jgi:hypothetical protein
MSATKTKPVIFYDPDVAQAIGVHAAAVLNLLSECLSDNSSFVPISGNEYRGDWAELSESSGYKYGGRYWVAATYHEIGSMIGLSDRQAGYAIAKLVAEGLLIRIGNPVEAMIQTYWYSVNSDRLAQVKS